MDKEQIIDIVRQYKELVMKHFDFSEIILFGSYANQTATEDSDIDVAIVIKNSDYEYFKIVPLLWKLRRQIDYRIEPILIDLQNDNSGFSNEIYSNGIIVN